MPKRNPCAISAHGKRDDTMVTIRNIDETFRFYGSFGAKQMDVRTEHAFTFSDKNSYIRFWGDLQALRGCGGFTPREDVIFRSQIHQRYLGIGFHEEGIMSVICESPTPGFHFRNPAALFSIPLRPIF